jgi:hypothetical protein
LHWSTDFTEQFFDVVGRSIDTCAALKEAILAFELLVLDAPEVIALSRVSTTLDLFQEMLNSQHEYGTELMWTTGFLVCHIAVSAPGLQAQGRTIWLNSTRCKQGTSGHRSLRACWQCSRNPWSLKVNYTTSCQTITWIALQV